MTLAGIDITTHSVDVDIDGLRIVSEATLDASAGTVVGLIGPNGSGKSSLLKAIYRVLRPNAGTITIDGADLWSMSAMIAAHKISVVLQDDLSEFDFTGGEIVALGRVPHRSRFGRRTPEDQRAIAAALRLTATEHLTDRPVSTLSGGERQRIFLARAFAQQTPVLILDEPTNHLDVLAQIETLDLVTALPATIVVALHDLNLAASYCDQLYVLDRGRIVAHGKPTEVLTPELIAQVYGVIAEVSTNPLTGRPALFFGGVLRPRAQPSSDLSKSHSSHIAQPEGQYR